MKAEVSKLSLLKECVYDVIHQEVWDYVVSCLGEPGDDEAILSHYQSVHDKVMHETVRSIWRDLRYDDREEDWE